MVNNKTYRQTQGITRGKGDLGLIKYIISGYSSWGKRRAEFFPKCTCGTVICAYSQVIVIFPWTIYTIEVSRQAYWPNLEHGEHQHIFGIFTQLLVMFPNTVQKLESQHMGTWHYINIQPSISIGRQHFHCHKRKVVIPLPNKKCLTVYDIHILPNILSFLIFYIFMTKTR